MPLFAVSLLLECRVAGALLPDPMHQLAIHIVQANNPEEAQDHGTKLGANRQHAYRNADNEEVSWHFKHVVECQELFDPDLKLDMEVSSWLFNGETLRLNDSWSPPPTNT